MQGLRRRVDDETERTSRDRKTDESGNLASGAFRAFRGWGGGADSGCHAFAAAAEVIEERELLVPLTKRALRADALIGIRTEGAAFIM